MLWIKAFHIIGVIAWMAGLLYLPRLFVYHANAPTASNRAAMLKVMERRLYHFIMMPAMAITVFFGAILVWQYEIEVLHEAWFIAKIFLVFGLIIAHFLMGKWRHDFVREKNRHSAKFFRMVNEIPTLIMILIVILVVVRPF